MDWGECRFNPPEMVPLGKNYANEGDAIWPPMSGANGWCHQFEQKIKGTDAIRAFNESKGGEN